MAAPAIAVGDVMLVTFKGTLCSQLVLNTFKYRVEGFDPGLSVFDFADWMFTRLTAAGTMKDKFRDCCPTNYQLDQIWIQRVLPDDKRVRKSIYVVDQNGGAGYDADTANVAQSIERRADVAKKYGVGRVQLPAATESGWMLNGILTTLAVNSLNALAGYVKASLTQALSGNIAAPVLAKFVPGGYNYQYITQAFAQTTVRVMRRRTVGLGK